MSRGAQAWGYEKKANEQEQRKVTGRAAQKETRDSQAQDVGCVLGSQGLATGNTQLMSLFPRELDGSVA
jgi:hypothetical protein